MESVKLCPGCNTIQDAKEIICPDCGADLTGIVPGAQEEPIPGTQRSLEKVCSEPSCGGLNLLQATECVYCGERFTNSQANVSPITATYQKSLENNIALRPYKFKKEEFYRPDELAFALAANWDDAVKQLQRGYLAEWFAKELMDQELATTVTDLTENDTLTGDRKLQILLTEMNPELPPMWKGHRLAIQDLQMIASSAIRGTQESSDLIEQIFNNAVLAKVSTETHTVWNQQVDLFEQAWQLVRQKGAKEHLRPDMQTVLPYLLLMSIDRGYTERLRARLCRKINTSARHHSFIKAVGPPEEALPAQLLVLQVLAETADQEVNNEIIQIRNATNTSLHKLKRDFGGMLDSTPSLRKKIATIESALQSSDYSKMLTLKQTIKSVHAESQKIADQHSKIKNNVKLLKGFGESERFAGLGELAPNTPHDQVKEVFNATQQQLSKIDKDLEKLVRELMQLGYDSDSKSSYLHPKERAVVESAVSATPKYKSIQESLKITKNVLDRKASHDQLQSQFETIKKDFPDISKGNNPFSDSLKRIEKILSEPDQARINEELKNFAQLRALGNELNLTFESIYSDLREIVLEYDEIIFVDIELREKVNLIQSVLDECSTDKIPQAQSAIRDIYKKGQCILDDVYLLKKKIGELKRDFDEVLTGNNQFSENLTKMELVLQEPSHKYIKKALNEVPLLRKEGENLYGIYNTLNDKYQKLKSDFGEIFSFNLNKSNDLISIEEALKSAVPDKMREVQGLIDTLRSMGQRYETKKKKREKLSRWIPWMKT